jgi:hypothetical protein
MTRKGKREKADADGSPPTDDDRDLMAGSIANSDDEPWTKTTDGQPGNFSTGRRDLTGGGEAGEFDLPDISGRGTTEDLLHEEDTRQKSARGIPSQGTRTEKASSASKKAERRRKNGQ